MAGKRSDEVTEPVRGPRRVLFLAANAAEMTRLDLDKEMREIKSVMDRGIGVNRLKLVVATAPRVIDLQHVLASEEPDIVHFGGHGSNRTEQLVFLGTNDEPFLVDIEALADLLGRYQGVVLNACVSARQAEAVAHRGAWAIGMAAPIATDAAVVFSRAFYSQLADGAEPIAAFEAGRLQLRLEGHAEAAALPRFYAGDRVASTTAVRTPTTADAASPQSEPQPEPWHEPRATELALAEFGLRSSGAEVVVSACVITDNPERLVAEIARWRGKLLRDPLVLEAVKQRARKADLATLFDEPAFRPRLMEWLSVTSFSAYVYYGHAAALATLSPSERERRFLVEPILQRMRKKSERITRVHSDVASDRAGLSSLVDRAGAALEHEGLPRLPAPELAPGTGDPLTDLAALLARTLARHLSALKDQEARAAFECMRTRVRFAMNVTTHAIHTRDKNPLP